MLDILRFIVGNGFWNFVGCVVVIALVLDVIPESIRAWRKPKP